MQTGLSLYSQEEWWKQLVNECRSIVVETTFSANELVIKGKWLLGERVIQDESRLNVNFAEKKYYSDPHVLEKLAEEIKISLRELQRCIQFKLKYPNLVARDAVNLEPFNNEGKTISWHKITNFYLPESSAKEQEIDENLEMHNKCPKCGYEW